MDTILDHPLIASRYFFPRATTPDPAHRRTIDVGDAQLSCSYYDHDAPVTLLHFHGNGEVVADWEDVFPTIAKELGLNLLLAEYRGYGGSTGEPLLGKMLKDAHKIAEEIPGPFIAFGRSVGSIFAVELVSHPRIKAMILESGIADVRQRILLRLRPEELGVGQASFDEVFANELDHQKKLGSYSAPLLLLHTENDGLVEVEHAHLNARWAQGSVENVIFERGDHNSIFFYNQSAYIQAITDFVRSLAL